MPDLMAIELEPIAANKYVPNKNSFNLRINLDLFMRIVVWKKL